VTELYDLLPEVYRTRDAQHDHQLQALLRVIEEQRQIVADEIDGLYADWFIETCADWVVPYLGALVGSLPLPGYDEALGSGTAPGLLRAVAPRRDVADAVADRRRKGTLAVLEDLAADVAGWPARAVEFRRLLGLTPSVRLFGPTERARRGALADLRRGNALDRVDGPFDELSHTVDVRRVNSARTVGRHNIPEVGLFVWRLGAYSITRGPAYCRDRDRRHFTFSILGNDTPLITKPGREPDPTHIADESAVPAFIRRRAFADHTGAYYGPGRSLAIWLSDGDTAAPIPLERIVAADLSGWRYVPARGQVAVDPVLGRIAFPARHAPDTGVWVTYHHGFSADIGGGEYPRPEGPDTPFRVGTGQPYARITDAVEAWREAADPPSPAVIELVGSTAYQEQLEILLRCGDRLVLRAANGSRPVLRLLDWYSNRPDALRIVGTGEGDGPPPQITLDGLLVTGRSVRVEGDVGQVTIRDCTLVPGWSIDERCRCEHPGEPSLELIDTPACLQIERSIVGTILVDRNEVHHEPGPIFLSDCVVDTGGGDGCALSAPDGRPAYTVLSARRTTVFGAISTRGVGLVENCILGALRVERRQQGCVRFSALGPGSTPPPQFHGTGVRPVFTSRRYGTPGYAQLGARCPEEIFRGADDGAEMGAFHDLFQPQRIDNLRRRLAEYQPAGGDADLIIVS
jgi:hypothetical protein